jgi:hypothetical protein
MARQTSFPSTSHTRIPSPAIVAQDAVRRFPRWALIALCIAYVLAGFAGREPWRSEDLIGFAGLLGWLGTGDSAWLLARFAAMLLLGLTFFCTWYATYYLARRDAAQPVPFAFGGEAKATDYARAIADGAMLAFIACLGLAQLGHETTKALVQLTLTSLVFFGCSAYTYHPMKSILALVVGGIGLLFVLPTLRLDANNWLVLQAWRESIHMLVWFAWPAWALGGLALFKWRRHLLTLRPALHIGLPFIFVLLHIVFLPAIDQKDRWFLSALPSLATLAAFALPTLRRAMKSVIDLFTLIFFSGCAAVIWVVWIAMQTGVPPQPAANVARLLPAFTPTFSAPVLLLALAATLAWGFLVYWRIGKHRPAIWMSMVLPAGGAALCWALLMSLWLPLLDHARSYQPLMSLVQKHMASLSDSKAIDGCVYTHGLSGAQQAALRYYTKRPLIEANRGVACGWLVTDSEAVPNLPEYVALSDWKLITTIRRPSDKSETWLIYAHKQ